MISIEIEEACRNNIADVSRWVGWCGRTFQSTGPGPLGAQQHILTVI